MGIYTLNREQQLYTDIETAWEFFSAPENLKVITPDYLGFQITSPPFSKKMYTGQAIAYKVSPIAGIKLNWATVITTVKEPHYFIDEQKVGPYSLWHHQHHFEENEHGVLMTDIVTYALPWYALGAIGHRFIVKPKLEEIFNYRNKVVNKLFNSSEAKAKKQPAQ